MNPVSVYRLLQKELEEIRDRLDKLEKPRLVEVPSLEVPHISELKPPPGLKRRGRPRKSDGS